MHINYITSDFPKNNISKGGIGTFVNTITASLTKCNIKTSVIDLNLTNEHSIEEIEGVTIYRIKKSPIKFLGWIINTYKLYRLIHHIDKTNKIDIVETSELGLAFLPKKKGIKYIIRLHGGHHFLNEKVNKWKAIQEKISFKKADGFIAVSNFVKNETNKYLSFHHKPIKVIYNPISIKKFTPFENVLKTPYNIVFVGTVYEKKGVRELIQALSIVHTKYPEATLNIYGRDWKFPDNSSYIEYLRNHIQDVNWSKIVFHGSIQHDEIPMKYAQAHLCVFPSHVESQGLVVLEAMAMEKVVIFSKIGIGEETIKNYYNGLLCEVKNPVSIAEKIIWAFDNDDKILEIEKNARTEILTKFDLDRIIKENIAYYQEITNQ